MAKKRNIDIPLGPVSVDWTWEQVYAAQLEFDKTADSLDPARPINQYSMLKETLPLLQSEFELGNKRALSRAIYFCALYSIAMPYWVARAFSHAYDDVELFNARSWDDFLGLPLPAGKRLARARKVTQFAFEAYVRAAHKIEEGCPTDKGTFENVADEINAAYGQKCVNGTDVGDFYYQYSAAISVPNGDGLYDRGPAGVCWSKFSNVLSPEFDTYLQERLKAATEKK